MRLRTFLVLGTVLVMTVGVATATAGGGNSANAKLCQKGGWQDQHRTDGSTFANQGACVSYAAHGGELEPTGASTTASELLCESFGGTYTAGTTTGTLWTCSGWLNAGVDDWLTKIQEQETACSVDGGLLASAGLIPGASDSSCRVF